MPNLPPSCAARGLLTLAAALGMVACAEDSGGPTARPKASSGSPDAGQGAAAARSEGAGSARVAASTSGPALDARFELEVVGKPEGLLAIDLDRDGKDELVVLARTPGRLTCFTRLPEGWRLTGDSRDLTVDDYSLGPVALGAESGAARIAFASRSSRAIVLVDLRAPAGDFEVARLPLESPPRAITAGHLDDGQGERLVVATAAGTLVHWDGASAPRRSTIVEREVSCLHLLADGSGLVVGDRGARTLSLYPNGSEEAVTAQLAGMPRALLELDLDRSGDTELVVAGGDRELWTFGLEDEAGPVGWFTGAAPHALELDRIPLRLARGDVSGDGRDEVIALFFGQLSYRVLTPGAAGSEVARGYAGQAPWDLAVGDFDGDDRLDLAFANRDARRVGLLYGAPGGGLRRADRFPTGRAPHSIAALDADGDERLDLAVIHSLEDTWALYSNTVEGWRASTKLPTGPGANHLRAVDLQADGRQELAWTSTDAQGARLVFGAVPGTVDEVPLPAPIRTGRSASDLVLTDLDGNGIVEAFVCDRDAGALSWVRFGWDPVASAISSTVTSLELPASPTAAVRISIDETPTLVVACADDGGGSGLAFVQPRDGVLVVTDFAPCTTLPVDLAAADLEGDGRMELVVLSKPSALDNGGAVELWRRDGAWARIASSPTGQRPYAVGAGDWSADGTIEIAVTAQNSHNVGLWRATRGGDGRIALKRQADLGAGLGPLDLLVEDLDGDGRLELVVAGAFSDDVTVIHRGR